jgi:hypothetical protein
MFKKSTPVVAILVTGVLGLACSNSGLKSTAHDAGAASGGQAGSTISSETASGTGGTIGPGKAGGATTGGIGGLSSPGGAGGTNISATGGTIGTGGSNGSGGTAGSSGTGGTGGQGPMCALYPMCNPGDQQVGSPCPPGRECYSLSVSCGLGQYNTITCAYGADAGVDAGALDVRVDVSGKPEPDSSSQRVGAPHPQPCLPDEVLNWGLNCSSTLPLCSGVGDHWCYTQCQQGGTCVGGFVCEGIGIFSGGEVSSSYSICDGSIGAPVGGACRSDKDCNAGTSCVWVATGTGMLKCVSSVH